MSTYQDYLDALETLDVEAATKAFVAFQSRWLTEVPANIVEIKKSIVSREAEIEHKLATGEGAELEKLERWLQESKDYLVNRYEFIEHTKRSLQPDVLKEYIARQINEKKEEVETEQKWKAQTIKIGEDYIIDPVNKKSFIEVGCIVGMPENGIEIADDGTILEIEAKEEEDILCEVWDCWRGGSISVTPETEEEVKRLQDILANPGKFEFDTRQWKSAYMDHCWDGGCDFGIDFYVDGFEEHKIMTDFYEQDDFYNVTDYVEDLFERELLTHDKINIDTQYVIHGCEIVSETRW